MAIATYTKSGAKASTAAKLDKNVFAVDVTSHDLLHRAYVGYLSNGRKATATTKTRGLVRGGGRKPWKQKGTGRARFGSIRNPIWRGGGIVFGPSGEENYTKKMPVQAKRLAIRQALTLAAEANQIIVVEEFAVQSGKTADAKKLLEKIGATKNILIVTEDKSTESIRATRNLQNVEMTQARYLNVYDVLNADTLVFTKKALSEVTEWLGGDK